MPWKGIDQYTGNFPEPFYRGSNRPMWDSEKEAQFQQWWQPTAQLMGLNPNPDDPGHQYDYRGLFSVNPNQQPAANGHWPSIFKYLAHPNRWINGYDTVSGNLAPMITNWMDEP